MRTFLFQRLNTGSNAFNRLYQANSMCDSLKSGLPSRYNLESISQTAQINIAVCKKSEFMAGSQYHQTTR